MDPGTHRGGVQGGLAALLCAACLWLAADPAVAGVVRDGGAVPPAGARGVFELVRRAYEQGDQQALADLVHADGLRVRSGGAGSRETEYSPSQSFYYFKNLFQAHRTVSFAYLRMEEVPAGERVHAMALWTNRRPGRDPERESRLVIVLSRQGDAWRMTEITNIR